MGVHYARIYVDGVLVSHPELYNDGRYVFHVLHGFLRPLVHSCFHDDVPPLPPRQGHHLGRDAASMVPIMLRDAIAHLEDGGYGFVVLAMRVKFAEMEKFPNLTMFALDDQAIFVGGRQVRPVAGGAPACQARKSERPTLLLFFKTSKR